MAGEIGVFLHLVKLGRIGHVQRIGRTADHALLQREIDLVQTLLAAGWVSYDERRRVYALASRLLGDVSGLVARQGSTSGLVRDELARLSAQTGTTCVLSRVDADGSFVVVDRAD